MGSSNAASEGVTPGACRPRGSPLPAFLFTVSAHFLLGRWSSLRFAENLPGFVHVCDGEFSVSLAGLSCPGVQWNTTRGVTQRHLVAMVTALNHLTKGRQRIMFGALGGPGSVSEALRAEPRFA